MPANIAPVGESPEQLSKRIQRLEEDAAMNDRTVAELSTQLYEANKTLDAAVKRIAKLEDKLNAVAGQSEGIDVPDALDDVPPHAFGGPNRPGE